MHIILKGDEKFTSFLDGLINIDNGPADTGLTGLIGSGLNPVLHPNPPSAIVAGSTATEDELECEEWFD